MVIFVSHFRVFPVLDRNLTVGWAYVATVAAGVGIWVAVGSWPRARAAAGRHAPRAPPDAVPSRPVVAVAVD